VISDNCVGLVSYHLTMYLSLSSVVKKKIKIGERLAKLQAKKVVRFAVILLKDEVVR